MQLDRQIILDTAFAVLDEHGLDGLSLRTIAKALSVKAPSLYWHVENKAALISLMAGKFYAAAFDAQAQQTDWQGKLLAFARTFRTALLQHRDSARLCAIAPPAVAPDISSARIAEPLVIAGLAPDRAVACQASVIAYALGWVVYEQSPTMHDHLAHMFDFTASFDAGLVAMVDGFAVKA